MQYICISINKESAVFFCNFQIAGKESLSLFGDKYNIIAKNLCFDWIVGDSENVIGIDFAFTGSECFWLENEKKELNRVFDFSYKNARFWLGDQKKGKLKFCCDWEDYYFRSKKGGILICVSTHMLDNTEVMLLKKHITKVENDS